MRRFILAFFLLAFTLIFFSGNYVFAEAGNEYNERWMCLDVKRADQDDTIGPFPPPKEYLDAFNNKTLTREMTEKYFNTNPQFIWYNHSGVIKTKGTIDDNPLPNSDTYVVTCIQIPVALQKEDTPREVCTTGNGEADMKIWNNDQHKKLEDIYSPWDNFLNLQYKAYRFFGYYKKDLVTRLEPENTDHIFKTDAQGNFKVGEFVYVDATWQNAERKFMSYNRFPKNPVDNVQGLGGVQQDDLEFDFNTTNKNCAIVAWDPYGVVFDSQTLEPIPGVSVTLNHKNKNNIFSMLKSDQVPGGYIRNPYTVAEDGYFSFIVPDGTYRLSVAAEGYKFPSSKNVLHPNFDTIYSDIYYGTDIIQKGKMEHRDIPLEPINPSVKKTYPATLMGLFQTALADGKTNLDGRVSHPFAKINTFCKTVNGIKGSPNITVQADKTGKFSLDFDPLKCNVEKGEMYGIVEVESIDLTKPLTRNLIVKNKNEANALSRSTSYSMDPLLNYVEGYAYDSYGTPLKNAQVGTYNIGDKNPYATVTADSSGYFSLTTNKIPMGPYELRYITADKKVFRTPTSRFITQNLATIKAKRINLYSQNFDPTRSSADGLTTTSPSALLNRKEISNKNTVINQGTASKIKSNPQAKINSQTNPLKNQFVILLLLILLMLIGGGIIFAYILKNQKTAAPFDR